MLIGAIISALTPIIGGITGLWGSKIEKTHELAKSKVDLDVLKENNRLAESLADKEYNRLVKISEIDQEKLVVATEAESLQKSYEIFTTPMTPKGTPLTGWRLNLAVGIDAFNNSVRPGSTLYYQMLLGVLMTCAVVYIYIHPEMFTTPEMQSQLIGIIFALIDMILFQAGMSLGWWFGNRGMAQRGKR